MNTAEKRAQLEAGGEPWPDCDCHDEPMLWQPDSRMQAEGYFKCRIVNRRQRNEWREARRERGSCPYCGAPVIVSSRCEECADYHADYMAQPYQKLRHRAARARHRQKVRGSEGFQPTGVGLAAFAAYVSNRGAD